MLLGLTLAFSLVVTAEPTAYSPGARVHLVDVDAPVVNAQYAPPEDPYAGWSRQQLLTEYFRLDREKPGIGLPIALIVTGAVTMGITAIVALYGLLISAVLGGGVPIELVTVLAMGGFVGLGTLLTGVWQLKQVQPQRDDMNRRMEDIDARLSWRQTTSAQRDVPVRVPSFTLARF
jgi:hypothetical protein